MNRIKEFFVFFAVMLIPVWILVFVGLLLYFLVIKPTSSSFWDVLPVVALGSLVMTVILMPALFALLWIYAQFEMWRMNLLEDIKEAANQNDR